MRSKKYSVDFESGDEQVVVKKKRKSHFLRNLLIFLLICGGIFLFLRSDYFIIKDIEVEGNTYYTDSEIKRIAEAKTGNNIIFNAEIDRMEGNLEQNPFFKTIKIKRKLPNTLVIEVEERTQMAAIEFGDKYVVIDEEGVVLRMTHVDPKVTILTGLTISKMDIGEPLEAEEKENLSMTLRMLKTMQEGDLYFKMIDVSKVVIKAYIYDTLIVKGTPSEVFSAIEAGDVQLVVSDLFDKGISRGTIKMGGSGTVIFTPDIEDGD